MSSNMSPIGNPGGVKRPRDTDSPLDVRGVRGLNSALKRPKIELNEIEASLFEKLANLDLTIARGQEEMFSILAQHLADHSNPNERTEIETAAKDIKKYNELLADEDFGRDFLKLIKGEIPEDSEVVDFTCKELRKFIDLDEVQKEKGPFDKIAFETSDEYALSEKESAQNENRKKIVAYILESMPDPPGT